MHVASIVRLWCAEKHRFSAALFPCFTHTNNDLGVFYVYSEVRVSDKCP